MQRVRFFVEIWLNDIREIEFQYNKTTSSGMHYSLLKSHVKETIE